MTTPICPDCHSTDCAPNRKVAGRYRCRICTTVFDADTDMSPPAPPAPRGTTINNTLRILLWVGVLLWCCFLAQHYLSTIGRASSAIQEAALAATTSTGVILAYVVARAVEALITLGERKSN